MILKKKGYKQNLIRPGGSNNSKIVFILLTKVITLYVKPITIDVRKFCLKMLFFYSIFQSLSLKDYLNNLLQVFFDIMGNVNKNLKRLTRGPSNLFNLFSFIKSL